MRAQWSDAQTQHKPTVGVHRYSTTTIPAIVVMPSVPSAHTTSMRQQDLAEQEHQISRGAEAERRSSDQKRVSSATLVASPRSPTAKLVSPTSATFRASPVSSASAQLHPVISASTAVNATLSELAARLHALDGSTQHLLVQRWAHQLELPRYRFELEDS